MAGSTMSLNATDFLPPPPFAPAEPPAKAGSMVIVGVIICLCANLTMSFGTNVLKAAHSARTAQMQALLDKAKPGEKVKLPPLYKSRLWLIGFTFFKGGNLSNFFALAFAPQSLLSALAAIQFVSNVVFARLLLKERASKRTLMGVATIISGIMLLVIFGAHTSKDYTPQEIDMLYTNPWFILYLIVLFSGAAVAYVKFRAAESCISDAAFVRQALAKAYRRLIGGKVSRATLAVRSAAGSKGHKRTRSDAEPGGASNDDDDDGAPMVLRTADGTRPNAISEGDEGAPQPSPATPAPAPGPPPGLMERRIIPVCFALYSAAPGTFTVVFSKLVAIYIRLTTGGENMFARPEMYLYIILLVVTGVWWDKQMNAGLRLFPAVVIMPTMQVAWTVLCILNGGIFFKEFADLPEKGKVFFVLGLLIVLSGMGLLIPKPPKSAGGPGSSLKQRTAASIDGSVGGSVPPSPAGGVGPTGLPSPESSAAPSLDGTARAVTFTDPAQLASQDGLPPPLPPKPFGARGAAILRQLSVPLNEIMRKLDDDEEEGDGTHKAYAAFEFCPVFAVPTLEEVVKEAQDDEEEIPAFLMMDAHLSTMGEKLDHVLDLVVDPRQLLTETSQAARSFAGGLMKRTTGPGGGGGQHAPLQQQEEEDGGDTEMGERPAAAAAAARQHGVPPGRTSSDRPPQHHHLPRGASLPADGGGDLPASWKHLASEAELPQRATTASPPLMAAGATGLRARSPSPMPHDGGAAPSPPLLHGAVGAEDVSVMMPHQRSSGGDGGGVHPSHPIKRPSGGLRGAALLQQAANASQGGGGASSL